MQGGRDKGHSDVLTVRGIALSLPGVEESSAYGQPAFKVDGKLLASFPTHRSAEPGSLVVAAALEDRAKWIEEAPDVYYAPEHYVGHPFVLVRLAKVHPEDLRRLLVRARSFVARGLAGAKKPPRRRGVKRSSL